MHELSDQEILNEIALKNRKAFDGLYQSQYKKLFMLSFKYTQDQEVSEEVVHDVFIKVWKQSSSLKIVHSLGSYLSKAVINTSLNAIKKIKALNEHHDKYKDEFFNKFDNPDDEATVIESKLIALENAIQNLPPQCKRILLMSKYEKQKQQEIAMQLNISVKTVKNHLTYAYKKLKEVLGNGIVILLIFVLLYRTF